MATRRPASLWLWLGIAAAVVLLDQITKTLITRSFQLNDIRTITPFFDLVRAHNTGAAFSFLAGPAAGSAGSSSAWARSPRCSSSGCWRATAASGCSAGRWR